ncbi:MAG: UDP-N-acetylmuramoyl-L-alanyl-D-glutamate--2,6-diaminopimelate ligase [Acidobacteriota bacterium]|jgi:UDP-N-acetylmuramoyl-L-alanyl-D-glutamate--2,6-diaminopimelate ligase|nr:UDP-N-acetylmuramoyl-L-alanyl-D-glutamate--2,6-diaminopimelate ligase [Acidobacteriota bacterium]
MKLTDLLRDVPVRQTPADADPDITSITPDSRMVRPGALFVAIPGTVKDGSEYIPQAVQKGAAAIVATSQPPTANRQPPTVLVDDPRAALALIAANFYGRPADKLSLIGVTGTSGKTTTTRMIEAVFDATGKPAGLIGTIEYRAGSERLTADRTTPDAAVLQEWFAKMVGAGVRHAVMEVSSHALELKRTYGIRFGAAVFTNLSREHFDFHGNFENYFAAKRILFSQIDHEGQCAVVNIDDEYGRKLAGELGACAITFGRDATADIHPDSDFSITVEGLRGTVITPRGEIRVDSPLLGLPNLYNWLGAIGACLVVGMPLEAIEAGIHNLTSVRGRFERVAVPSGGPTVIVDYAHKPDALEKLLLAVREIAKERKVTVLFGCGGDRDKGKRPEMGAIAARLANEVIVTSDNPRGETPQAIIDEITAGMSGAQNYRVEADRRTAISDAIQSARTDDVIVIAGKGHETYQVIGDEIVHFDDREEAELALKKRNDK